MFDPNLPFLRRFASPAACLMLGAVTAALAAAPATAAPIRPDPLPDIAAAVSAVLFPTAVHLPGLPLTAGYGRSTAIVILGYGLQPDGTMRPELIQRLEAGYIQALLAPQAPVIVTGGNPENGVTEAQAMAAWLIARGLPPARIHPETRATTTAENARYSHGVMNSIGARNAVVVTSSNHVRRAVGDFVSQGVPVIGTLTPDPAPLAAIPFGPR